MVGVAKELLVGDTIQVEVTLSPPCMPLVNDLGGLVFLKYSNVSQLGGMAIVIDGIPQFSAPLDIWAQLVTTPHP